jgi:hypothetical protein
MRYFIGGILAGVFFYVLLAAKERIMSGAESPDERICSMARICGVAFLAMLCWESFEYFFRERQSAASLFALRECSAVFSSARRCIGIFQ